MKFVCRAIWMEFIFESRWTMSLSRPGGHLSSAFSMQCKHSRWKVLTYLRIGLIINTLGYLVWTICHNNNSHRTRSTEHTSDMNLHILWQWLADSIINNMWATTVTIHCSTAATERPIAAARIAMTLRIIIMEYYCEWFRIKFRRI